MMARGHVGAVALLVLILIILGWLVYQALRHRGAAAHARQTGQPRRLRPRTADACPLCQTQSRMVVDLPLPSSGVRPWREGKSRRGRPKQVATEGHACPLPTCPYRGITDAAVHALIGYGHHGTTDHIQDFLCQACGTKISARRDTALFQIKTPPQRVGEVLSALAEGLSVDATVRVFGYGEPTIRRWLTRAGRHTARIHRHLFRHLALPHVQLDEIRTRLRQHGPVLWRWLVVDPSTKIVPVLHLGPRTQQSAYAVVHALVATLTPGAVPIVTSAGLMLS